MGVVVRLVHFLLFRGLAEGLLRSSSLVEETLQYAFQPEERYLSYSHNFLRLTNNMYQVKSMMALAVRTNRSLLVLDLAGRPPDHLFDFKAMKDYMSPHKILYLPALHVNGTRQLLESTGILQTESNKYTIERCYSFNRYRNMHSKLWHFAEKPRNLGTWEAFMLHVKISPEKVVVVCDMASFYSVFTDSSVATIPFASRFRDESARLYNSLPSFSFPSSGLTLRNSTYGPKVTAQIKKVPFEVGTISLGVHYRRTDMTALGVNVSILLEIIHQFIQDLSVRRIFIATDAEEVEMAAIRSRLPSEVFITCTPDNSTMCIPPEEQLLVEEGICMMTNYFLGSPGSSVSILIHQMRGLLFGHHSHTSILTNPEPYFGGWIPRLGDWGWGPEKLIAFASQLYASRKPKPHEVF